MTPPLVLALALLPACSLLAGLDDYRLRPDGSGGSGASAGGGDAGSGCGADEVEIPAGRACIDRYEASRGTDDKAASVAGVMPWDNVTNAEAQAACKRAGKRLCELEEWRSACAGAAGNIFPYGSVYEGQSCNGAHAGVSQLVETGSFSKCEGGVPGLFDMSGNAWEWSAKCDDNNDCTIVSGGYTDVDSLSCPSTVLELGSIGQPDLGFRCCRSL